MTLPAITRKTSAKYCPLQGVDKGTVSQILREDVPVDIKRAQRNLLRIPGFEDYSGLTQQPNTQADWFAKQLRSYMRIYDPKCPFEIAESEFLSRIDREAGVFAKTLIKRGETIQFLSGVCVPLTKEELGQLEASGKDFSVLQSSRNQEVAMYLGPARFVNHDCKANSEIVRADQYRARIVALKNIRKGDEITVFYGEHYFGDNNYQCLCRSCTRRPAKKL